MYIIFILFFLFKIIIIVLLCSISLISHFILHELSSLYYFFTSLSINHIPFFTLFLLLGCLLHLQLYIITIIFRWWSIIKSIIIFFFWLQIFSPSCINSLPIIWLITSISTICILLVISISLLFYFSIHLLKSLWFFQWITTSTILLIHFINIGCWVLKVTIIVNRDSILIRRWWWRETTSASTIKISIDYVLRTCSAHYSFPSSHWTIILIVWFFISFHDYSLLLILLLLLFLICLSSWEINTLMMFLW